MDGRVLLVVATLTLGAHTEVVSFTKSVTAPARCAQSVGVEYRDSGTCASLPDLDDCTSFVRIGPRFSPTM